MKTLCIVTHTEATHHTEKKVGGWYDSDLTEKGLRDALLLAHKIRTHGFELDRARVYSSDLKRAKQTACAIAGNAQSHIIYDHNLREMSYGTNEGLSQSTHARSLQPVNDSGDRLDHRVCEGAESRREVASRVSKCVAKIIAETDNALIVTHGFAGSFAIAAFQNIAVSSMGYLDYRLNPGSVTVLEEDDLCRNRAIRVLNR